MEAKKLTSELEIILGQPDNGQGRMTLYTVHFKKE